MPSMPVISKPANEYLLSAFESHTMLCNVHFKAQMTYCMHILGHLSSASDLILPPPCKQKVGAAVREQVWLMDKPTS